MAGLDRVMFDLEKTIGSGMSLNLKNFGCARNRDRRRDEVEGSGTFHCPARMSNWATQTSGNGSLAAGTGALQICFESGMMVLVRRMTTDSDGSLYPLDCSPIPEVPGRFAMDVNKGAVIGDAGAAFPSGIGVFNRATAGQAPAGFKL